MTQYIDKDALVVEIDNILDYIDEHWDTDYAIGAQRFADKLQDAIDTLEVKEVDLEEETKKWWKERLHLNLENKLWMDAHQSIVFAKHFFELGLNASNPIAEVNLESLVRQVIDLYLKAGKHYNNVIKEERKEYSGSDLAIKLLDGAIDAKELGIQYVLEKLREQKGE